MDSLRRLAALPGDYKVCPGHDALSTLETERKSNYYMREALGQRLIVVLQKPEQIPLISIRPVAAFCVVAQDGRTTYFTTAKEEPPCQPPMTVS